MTTPLWLIEKVKNFFNGDPDNFNAGVQTAEKHEITDLQVMQKMREFCGIYEGDDTKVYLKWNNTTKKWIATTDDGLGEKDSRVPDGDATHLFIMWNNSTLVFDKKTLAEYLIALGLSQVSTDHSTLPTGLKQFCIDTEILYYSIADGETFAWKQVASVDDFLDWTTFTTDSATPPTGLGQFCFGSGFDYNKLFYARHHPDLLIWEEITEFTTDVEVPPTGLNQYCIDDGVPYESTTGETGYDWLDLTEYCTSDHNVLPAGLGAYCFDTGVLYKGISNPNFVWAELPIFSFDYRTNPTEANQLCLYGEMVYQSKTNPQNFVWTEQRLGDYGTPPTDENQYCINDGKPYVSSFGMGWSWIEILGYAVNSGVLPTGTGQICFESGTTIYVSETGTTPFLWYEIPIKDDVELKTTQVYEANLTHQNGGTPAVLVAPVKNTFLNSVSFGFTENSAGEIELIAYDINSDPIPDFFNTTNGTTHLFINDVPGLNKATIEFVAEVGGEVPDDSHILIKTGVLGFDTDHLTLTPTNDILSNTSIRVEFLVAGES